MKLYLLFFSLLFLPRTTFAAFQPADSSDYYLILQNQKYKFDYTLSEGDYIIFDIASGKRHRGVVEKITPQNIHVNGEKFKIKDLKYIKKTRRKLRNWSIGTTIPTIVTIVFAIVTINLGQDGFIRFSNVFNAVLVLLAALSYLTLIGAIILWLVLLTSNVYNANLEKFDVKVKKK